MTPSIAPWQVWWINLDPVANEQAGRRPVVIVGSDDHCQFPIDLALVVPLTTHDRGLPQHVRIAPSSSGLDRTSWALTETIRAVSTTRLVGETPVGSLFEDERTEVGRWVRRMIA